MPFLQTLVASISQTAQQLEHQLQQHNTSSADLSLYDAKPAQLDDPTFLPAQPVFDLLEKLRIDARALEAAVTPTRHKLALLAMTEMKATALEISLELSIADAIEEAGGEISLKKLAEKVDVNENKLGRQLRILESEFIFKEKAPNVFANTRHSLGLLTKENGKPMLSFFAREAFEANLGAYANLTQPALRDDFAPENSPFSLAVIREKKDFLTWVMAPENATTAQKLSGVVPWLNKLTRPALLHDYPWAALGPNATIVDLGCGPADTALDLLTTYPNLRFICQDLPPVIERTEQSFATQPASIRSRISFLAHDYFGRAQPNPSRGAAFLLRGVLRDYDDARAHALLAHNVVPAMRASGPRARLLINEVLTGPPFVADGGGGGAAGGVDVALPPSELMAMAGAAEAQEGRGSAWPELANLMAQNAFLVFGGKERSSEEMAALVERAGLVVERLWRVRSFVAVVECRVRE